MKWGPHLLRRMEAGNWKRFLISSVWRANPKKCVLLGHVEKEKLDNAQAFSFFGCRFGHQVPLFSVTTLITTLHNFYQLREDFPISWIKALKRSIWKTRLWRCLKCGHGFGLGRLCSKTDEFSEKLKNALKPLYTAYPYNSPSLE